MPYPETIAYIKKQLEKGVSVDKIRKALSESGYLQEVIDQLLEQAGVSKQEKKSAGIEVLLRDTLIGFILIVVIGSLVYFNFFYGSTNERLSPDGIKTIKVDFSRISPITIPKDGDYTVNLADYVKDKNYDDSQITWAFSGKLCINVQITENKAILRSVFLDGCPSEETITFSASNPEGQTVSGDLKINIV